MKRIYEELHNLRGLTTITLTTGAAEGSVSVKAVLVEVDREATESQVQEVIFGLPTSESSEPVDF